MSENFVKKQMYECSKCKKLFGSRLEVVEHCNAAHKYDEVGTYIVSEKESSFAKIIGRTSDKEVYVDLVAFAGDPFTGTAICSEHMHAMPIWMIDKYYKVVTKDVFKSLLEKKFVDMGYSMMRSFYGPKFFKELQKDDVYREKEGDDGN